MNNGGHAADHSVFDELHNGVGVVAEVLFNCIDHNNSSSKILKFESSKVVFVRLIEPDLLSVGSLAHFSTCALAHYEFGRNLLRTNSACPSSW